MDLEQELRAAYTDRLDDLDLPPGDAAGARRAGARMRTRRRAVAGLAIVGVLAIATGGAFLGGRDLPEVGASDVGSHWQELPVAPLSPRSDALVVWTGDELVVMGGVTNRCPPGSSSCSPTLDGGLFRDDAAYDPTTERWRTLAPLPRAVADGQSAVVVDGHVIVATVLGQWLDYDVARDRWSTIATPFPTGREMDPYTLTADRDHVYTFQAGRVHAYDVESGTFSTLPADPLGSGFESHVLTATSSGLVLTAISSEPAAVTAPHLVQAVTWDGSHWRTPVSTGQVSNQVGWYWTGTHLVAPDTYVSKGDNARDRWTRSYPEGGVLDAATGAWSRLPQDLMDAAGADCPDLRTWMGPGRWLVACQVAYDDATGRVYPLGQGPDTLAYGAGAAWAGKRLMVFGGAAEPPSGGSGPTGLGDRLWVWTA